MALAQTSGLAEGLNLAGDSTLTRGQAVLLFYNLLFTKSKGSDAIYLTQLKGEVKQDLIILSTDAKAADGTSGPHLRRHLQDRPRPVLRQPERHPR